MTRSSPSAWIGARPTPGAITLLIGVIALFVTWIFVHDTGLGRFVATHLALTPRLALGREPWQLVTGGLVHLRAMSLLANAVGLWLFATAVEQQVGKPRMFTLFALAQLGGNLAVALAGRLLSPDQVFSGCDLGVLGLVAAFGVAWGHTRLSLFGALELSGRTLALVLLGATLVIDLAHLDFASLAGGVVAALVGWAVASERAAILWDRVRLQRLRRRSRIGMKVVKGGKRDPRFYN